MPWFLNIKTKPNKNKKKQQEGKSNTVGMRMVDEHELELQPNALISF